MNKLRNGGFELGTLDFWRSGIMCTPEITSASPHSGTYMANIVTTGVGRTCIPHNDYIEVAGHELVECGMYFKAFVANGFSISLRTYSIDLVELGIINSRYLTGSGTWQLFRAGFKIPPGVAYIRPEYVYTSTGVDEHWNLDDAYLTKISLNDLLLSDIALCLLTNLTASGDTSSDPILLLGFREYYADIHCISLTGTAPTLTVSVCELDVYDNEIVLGTFTILNAAGSERIKIDPPLGDRMYVKYVEGGTWTDCDFGVNLTGVR